MCPKKYMFQVCFQISIQLSINDHLQNTHPKLQVLLSFKGDGINLLNSQKKNKNKNKKNRELKKDLK